MQTITPAQTILETPRLLLREFLPEDHAALCEIFCDAETMAHYPHPFSEEEVQMWIDRNLDRYETYGSGLWAVVRRDTGEVIGDCGLTMQMIHGRLKPEVGFHINKKYWRQGYAA
ncbi:MAG: GNAT family N-acetyltransferase [Clostridia bacterium]|nr:GNAT family N-acetyltransferase [Clostridia bacterium]